MMWIALGIWIFGSFCFAAGAWWATLQRDPEHPSLRCSEEQPALHAAGRKR